MALPAVPFWYLRHGETDYNARGLSQGALDVALNATGRAQAVAAGPLLRGRGIAGIVTSPMLRTRETTEIVNVSLGLPVTVDDEIREVVFGGMEGKPLMPWFGEWMEGRYTPEGAETFDEVSARVAKAMTRILAKPGPVLIVCHGGVLRAVRSLLGLPREGLSPNAVPLLFAPGASGWEMRVAAAGGGFLEA